MGNKLNEHFRFVANKEQGFLRVDKFLVDKIIGTSRNRIQQAANVGSICANNHPIKSNYKVKPGDIITIVMNQPHREVEIAPENIPLNIVYEDDDVIVVDKPAELVVHPGHDNYTGTLVNAIAGYYSSTTSSIIQSTFYNEDFRSGLVHRIDKGTSGLLVFAKNLNAKTNLDMQFFRKTIRRNYWAVVWGNVKKEEETIKCNIGRNLHNRMLMDVFPNNNHGKPAITHYKVLERFEYVTLIECSLETGRTHQIRVHMKYIGHVLFNDRRYGGNEILKGNHHTKYKQFVQNCFAICQRQALHARVLGFTHPKTGKEILLESPLPKDMILLIERWRNFSKNLNKP
ncbi:RluA family pseudouridine synthase [Candidatus Azobacteroides pseudotrichonymphae]|uniref:Pseudouridine synthase n=1 Tax=Azobacteroides pseudotrichonymphae genomovar. CFP2 TaxID=511995 RepID=B6YQA6_AZOPC|nr:RluA family pseudouridine synthase [Candidatus Azobacteroides pseudotrichonymphae]BAG83378.1 ribosomal large subunit pseudouridine synthase D [Candidatus Azobacteroides pseudotrichonymphae genomovar. CFP2]